MSATPLAADLLAAAPGISGGVAGILRGLAAMIARALLRHPRYVAVIVPLWNYIGRTARRFDRVMQQLAAGTLRPSRSRPGRNSSGRRPIQIPRQRAWLIAVLRHEAAGYASQLRHLLAQPEPAALVAATPQAQRVLRPLCHMLGIEVEAIKPTLRAPVTRPARAGRKSDGTPSRQDARSPKQRAAALASGCSSAGGADHKALLRAHEGSERREQDALARPIPPLCPRLAERWPWVPHPGMRTA